MAEYLHEEAVLITGGPKPFGMMQGMSSQADRVFLVGYHAASGSLGAVLEHTTSGRILSVDLSGHADMAELISGSRRLNGRTVEWSGGDMAEVYRVYRAMAALSSLGA